MWKLRFSLFLFVAMMAVSYPCLAQQSKTLEVRPRSGVLAGQTAYTNSYAILIGVGDYAFLPKEKHLDFAAKDATDLRDVLIRHYSFPAENVTVLLDAQATRANIEAALSTLADDRVKPDDRILIYFSGHGQTVKLQDGGEMGFLIPYDAKVDLAHPENRSGYLVSCIPMDSIWRYLEASAAKHRLLIADSCFGGLLIKGKALSAEKPNRAVIASLLARPAMQAMSAGASNEEAQEDPKLGHSTYTFKLLEELKAQAATPDSVFLASELAAALKTSVGNLTDSKQTPQFGNYHGTEGDFVFVATEPQPVPLLAAPVAPAQAAVTKMESQPSTLPTVVIAPPKASGVRDQSGAHYLMTRTYKSGDVDRYKYVSHTAFNNPNAGGKQDVVVNMLIKETTREVGADGSGILEEKFEEVRTKFGDNESDMTSQYPVLTQTRSKVGQVLETRTEGGSGVIARTATSLSMLFATHAAFYAPSPVKEGDSWRVEYVDPVNKDSKTTGVAMLIGKDRVGSDDVLKVKFISDTDAVVDASKNGKQKVKSHTEVIGNVDLATGRVLKMTGTTDIDSDVIGNMKVDFTFSLVSP